MANQFFVPFNNEPSAIDYGNTARSYTCPAGKYAKITATLSVSVFKGYSNTATEPGADTDAKIQFLDSQTVEIWVSAADVVTVTIDEASTNTSHNDAAANFREYSDASSSKLLVNSNVVASIEDDGLLKFYYPGSAQIGTMYYWIVGNCAANFHVQEYDSIS